MIVTMIGAGSVGFTRRLLMDILAVPEFRDTEFHFMDIDPERLELVTNVCRKMIEDSKVPARIVPFLDRRESLRGARYVFCTIRVGMLEAFAQDIEIPMRYGVNQCVGDTLGPGGIFYALRTIPVLLDLARDMREVCPGALLMNYTNPMAMNILALHRAGGIQAIGLCHGVQGGEELIAQALDLPREELDFVCAGINHQTWYIKIGHRGRDMMPMLLEGFRRHPDLAAQEPCRLDMLERFGYFSTESNGHLSEYLPWYRKRPGELEQWISRRWWIGGEPGGYLRHCRETQNYFRENYPKWMSGELEQIKLGERSREHASYIMEGLELGRRYRGCFNVPNTGLITNLPQGCIVELPCYVDYNGIQPIYVGDLPMQCAAVCRASVTVQEMVVEASLTGNKDLVKQAMLMDPLTGAVCNTDEVWRMADEMFAAYPGMLPQFGL